MTALEQWPTVTTLPTGDRPCPVCGNYPSACTCRIGDGSPRTRAGRTLEQATRDRARHRAGKHRRQRRISLELDDLLGLVPTVPPIEDRPAATGDCQRCGTMRDPDGTCFTCRS